MLRIDPNIELQRTLLYFRTQQAGVSHTNKIRIAFQFLRNIEDNAQQVWEAVVFQLRVPQSGSSLNPAIERVLSGTNYDRYVRDAAIWTNDEYVDLVLVDLDE